MAKPRRCVQRTAFDRDVVEAGHLAEDPQRLACGQIAGDLVALGQITDTAAALRIASRQAVDAGFAGGGTREVEQDLDCSRFAGAIRSQKAEEFPFADGEVDAIQGGDPRTADRRPVLLFEA